MAAFNTFAVVVVPLGLIRAAVTTPRSVPPSCVKFLITIKFPAGTVIVRAVVVMTKLRYGAAITDATTRNRTINEKSFFMLPLSGTAEEIESAKPAFVLHVDTRIGRRILPALRWAG
jgi:hypothetical protein